MPIIGIKDTGFVIEAPIEKLSYYYNYDKKVEALIRVYGKSFYISLTLSKISRNQTLACVDVESSNPYITAIFSENRSRSNVMIKNIEGTIVEFEDGRIFDIITEIDQIPKDSLITYLFMAYLKEDKKYNDIISYIESYPEHAKNKKTDVAA